jgi:glycosyltransferase involved in cell wall biosynthesis
MQVSFFLPASLSPASGAYDYNHRMAAGLRSLGHTVQVVMLPGQFPDPDAAAVAAAQNAWTTLEPGVVPVIDGMALPGFAGLAPALTARGTVALVHHPASLETGLAAATARRLADLEELVLRAVSHIVVTSDQTAGRLDAVFRTGRDKIAVISPGIGDRPRSPGPLSPGPGSQGADRPGCAILSVGALIPRKGHDVLMRALSRLFDLDWRLTIAGSADADPVHAQGILALAEKLGIARRVDITGPGELEPLWQGAELFALATWYEGYGTAMAEALRRGLPVATTATGAATMLVAPEAGVICAPGDVEQLSKALRRLIFDRTLRRDMAQAAWQAGQTLPSPETQVAAFAAVLEAASLPPPLQTS